MAKSLDQLFEFLLEEIALDGEQGVTIKDLVRTVRRFYADLEPSSSSTSSPFPSIRPPINRPFISRLWLWLSQIDDISIGENNEFAHSSLDSVEAQFPGVLVNAELDPDFNAPTASNEHESQQVPPVREEDGPRLYANEELIYYAIAGHGPDPTRIFPSEYALLCRIAAARYDGILQGTLRQSTGQDKRSVPKRTDALQAKGYIVKKSVWTGGHKTSRLFLRRFAQFSPTSDTGQSRTVRLKHIASQIFSALKENSLLTQDDLALHLGLSAPPAISVLSQLLRHFVRKACLKKVKSAFAPASNPSDDLKICFQIAREPLDQDWITHDTIQLDLETSFEDAITAAKQASEAAEAPLPDEILQDEEELQITARTPMPTHRPAWNPDRLMSNVLSDLALTLGDTGFTNLIARQEITGFFVRRPVEALLVRLSHFALKSSPDTAKSIAIVRRHELDDGIAHYVHRTLSMYSEMVKRGDAEWSSLEGGGDFAKQLQRTGSNELAHLFQEDEYGLVQRAHPKGQMQNGVVAMEDLIASAAAATFRVRGGDPVLVETVSGHSQLSTAPRRADNRQRRSSTSTLPRLKKKTTLTAVPKFQNLNAPKKQGRNRKFTQGTWEFWREIFYAVRLQQDPTFPSDGTKYMSDPVALELFKARPPTMDECVLRSLDNQLPVPFQPQDIGQGWIDSMIAFSNRTNPGLYLTPTGMRGLKRPPIKSKIVVVRSDRLKELDFTTRVNPPPVFFVSSSVAHTIRYYRFARWWNKISEATLAEISLVTESPQTSALRPQVNVAVDVNLPASISATIPPKHTPVEVDLPVSDPALTPALTPAPSSKIPPIRGLFRERVPKAPSTTTPLRKDTRARAKASPIDIGSDTDATVTDPETLQRQVQAQRRQRTKHPREQTNTRDNAISESTVLSTGRSGRRRKPSQKAIESANVLNFHPRSRVSSPVGEVVEHYTDTVHGLGRAVSRQPMTPTPSPSPKANLQLGTSTAKSSTYAEPVSVAGDTDATHPNDASELSFLSPSTKVQNDELKKYIVILRIPSHKLVSFISDIAMSVPHGIVPVNEEESLETLSGLATPATVLNTTSLGDDLQQASQETSTTALDNVDNAVQKWVKDVQSFDDMLVSAANNEAMSEIVLPMTEAEAMRRRTGGISSRTRESSRATSTTVDSIHGDDIDSITASNADRTPKRKTHRIIKNTVPTPIKASQPPPGADTPRYLESRVATRYYRKFLMELVRMCDGVVPYQPSTLKRVMQPKCIEANIESNPNIKNTKSQIEQLVNTRRLKIMGFAFQRRGMSYTKKILALPNVQGTDPQFIALRDKMAELPLEDDYVPPELEAEAARIPSSRRWRHNSEESSGADTTSTPKRKQTGQRGSARPTTARLSFTPEPRILSPNNGFLTLKISKERLQSLRIGTGFTSHYFRLPAVPLQFESDASKILSATAAPTTVSERRSGVRISRNTKFSSATGKIQWRTPKLTAIPRTIQSILAQECQKLEIAKVTNAGSSLEKFEQEVDLVSSWEQRKWSDLQEPKPGEWVFIKHAMPRAYFLPVNVSDNTVFRMVKFNGEVGEVEMNAPKAVSCEVFANILDSAKTKRTRAAETLRRRKRKFDETEGRDGNDDASDYESSTPRRHRSRAATGFRQRKVVKEKKARNKRSEGVEVRGVGMRNLSTEQIHRLSVAIVVIRTLFGGLERHMDLHLLSRLFPDESVTLLRERWKVISARFMTDIDALGQDFQIKYLDALADERVPSVNFDNFGGTDWKGILDWALRNINKDGNKDLAFELPPTKDELFTLNELEVEESAPIRNLYTQSMVYAVPQREEAWCTVVFGKVLKKNTLTRSNQVRPVFPREDEECDADKARARSWVLAAILTPSHGFDVARVHNKLLKLAKTKQECESMIDSVLKKLQSDKVVVKSSNVEAEVTVDGRTYSGTYGWKVSSKFFDRLDSQRNISPVMLKRAAKYKSDVIDVAFARGRTLSISKDSDVQDGDMVAILNLLSMGMLQIKPGTDVPASRYGVDWERQEYKTKSMDKNLLAFTTVLEASGNYIYGDPLADSRQNTFVPRGGIDQEDGLGLIPAWFDIHHEFRPEIWEMILGAIVGLVSARPGVSSIEITRTLAWTLPLRDVEMVLQFLFNCRCIQIVYTGWETTEWWWLAIGAGHENGATWNYENKV